ncbi:hypothetical protein AB6A40_008642 [Gnathostoma spinigerum]|uniref:CEP76/DRC7 peptidase-like domain-containing protein n=1 Tax=Gnathostoma spinigerum TaxID=75299 RepID=A0ABD6EPZ1_9BILA
MIPFLRQQHISTANADLWMSVDQFLTAGYGDEVEHAILLCCWLLHCKINAFILLGSAIPEGEKAAYVLAALSEGLLLLNPSDGNVYESRDVLCPLTSVGTAIGVANVYANMQSKQHPSQISFNFESNSLWRGVLDKTMEYRPSGPTGFSYSKIDDDIVHELRSHLERQIKLKFDELRPFGIPRWNLRVSRLLRELLSEMEPSALPSSAIDTALSQFSTSHRTLTVAFRRPYISTQQTICDVLRTRMHLNSNSNVQFALAVHIKPYFNHVVSCSVAIASLATEH